MLESADTSSLPHSPETYIPTFEFMKMLFFALFHLAPDNCILIPFYSIQVSVQMWPPYLIASIMIHLKAIAYGTVPEFHS